MHEKPKILIVDDEDAIRLILSHALKKIHAEPIGCRSKAEALTLLREHDFTLVLLDKNLLDGSGLDLLRTIKLEFPKTQVIMVTAYASVETTVEALRLGVLDFILKPFELEAVANRVTHVLEHQRLVATHERLSTLIIHQDRLASLGVLSAGTAHEINNPLSFVSANLEFLQSIFRDYAAVNVPLPDAVRREVGQAIEDSALGIARIRSIVRDLGAFSRGSQDETTPVNLARVMKSAINMCNYQIVARATLVCDLDDTAEVMASEGLLAQVFLNLLVNASHAIPEGNRSAQQIRAHVRVTVDSAIAEIQDTGTGMSPEVRARIFEPFFTTKPSGTGTGLGLSIAHGIITSFGGRIEVDSEQGKGTTFRVTLPRHVEGEQLAVA